MARWYWNGVGIVETANGGKYAVDGLYDDGYPTLSHQDPRLLMRVGRPWTQKWPDVRKVGLGVLVWGPTAQDAEARLLQLRGLLGIGSKGILRHEFFSGKALEMQAEVTRFDTATKAPNLYRVALEFSNVDEPFFRDTSAVTTQATITATEAPYQVDFTHENPGVEDRGFTVRFYGPCSNPMLLNLTADPNSGLYVGFQGTIPSGDFVAFDIKTFRAYWQSGSNVNPVDVVHSGDRYWFVLKQGENALRFGADDTGGRVEIVQFPPF